MQIHRRFTGAVLTALFLGAVSLAQAQTVSISPTTLAMPAVGEQVTITLNAAGFGEVAGWELGVAFDTTALTFVSFTEGNFMKAAGATFATPQSTRVITGDADGLNSSRRAGVALLGATASGAGDLGTMTFTVVAQKATRLKINDPQFLDGNVAVIPVTTTGSTLTAQAANVPPVAAAGADQAANAGATVSFSGAASTDSDGTIATYAWQFGDGTTGAGATATHIYAEAGVFTVTLTVTDNSGATATDTLVVTVTAPVLAAIREHADGSPTLQLETQLPTADTHAHAYVRIWSGSLTITAGMELEYQVRMSSGNPTFKAAVDFATSGGTLRDSGAVDQNNISAHPNANLSENARDAWYHRRIALTPLVGATITEVALAVDSNEHLAGLFRAYFDNVQITDGTNRVRDIYIDGANVPLATPAAISEIAGQGGFAGVSASKVTAGVVNVSVDPRGKKALTWGALKSR